MKGQIRAMVESLIRSGFNRDCAVSITSVSALIG